MFLLVPLIPLTGVTSIFVGFEIIVGIITLLTFLFLWLVLYRGVRFEGDGIYGISYKPLDEFSEMRELGPGVIGGELGLVGCLFGMVFNVLWSFFFWIFAAVLLWLGINSMLLVMSVLFFPCYFIFQRSIRYITARGNACRGRLKESGLYAAWFAFIWGLWLFTLLYVLRYLAIRYNW